MNQQPAKPDRGPGAGPLMTELLILPDGGILVHNLTPVMAAILQEFNPDDGTIRPRAGGKTVETNQLPISTHEFSKRP